MHLDLTVHRHTSADGRRWSSEELMDLADGKITDDECKKIFQMRLRAGDAYKPRFEQPKWMRQMFLQARLAVDRAREKD